jgi:uncharacterized protein (DUF1499 family)
LSARYVQGEAHTATWARRLALFFLQLLVLTVVLARFTSLSTPAAMNLLAVSCVGLVLAILLALGTLIRIWFGGQLGAGQAFAGIVIALIGLALPLWYLAQFFMLPSLTDIETTPRQPIDFKQLTSTRPPGANPLEEPDETTAALQEQAYPDIRPMELERSSREVFDMVSEAVKRLGWTVVATEPPGDTGVGRIEATDRTMIMGFTDDVLVRVTGDDAHALIDVRSVSRYGLHDFGTNAERIRTLFAEVKSELEKGESTGLEEATETAPDKKLKSVRKRVRKRRGTVRRAPTGQESRPPLLSPD